MLIGFTLLIVLSSDSQVYQCRWTDGPITIDGKLDEPAWKNAVVNDGFKQHWLGPDKRPQMSTKAMLLWDRDHLYFAAELKDRDLYAKVTQHDGKTWFDDCFEIFLKPAEDKPGYYEFHTTPRNTRMDLFIPDRSSWDFDTQVIKEKFAWQTAAGMHGTLKAGDEDTGWFVEGKIPWSDFKPTGGRPKPNDRWLYSLCRYDRAHQGEPELSSTSPLTQKNFHRYEDFAKLEFVPPMQSQGTKASRLSPLPPITTSTVVGMPDPAPPFRAKRIWPKLKPDFPIVARFQPGTDLLWFVDEPGPYAPSKVKRTRSNPETGEHETLLDNAPGIIYDLCFHPRFSENGFVYFGLNEPVGDKKTPHSRIVRYTVDRKPPYLLDVKSRTAILDWPSNGHNGAAITFGNDGMMFVTTGDGTSESDMPEVGQDLSKPLAKVLRIDVDHPDGSRPYTVPNDNPFVNHANARPETWAYGLRNPWRIWSDPISGQLWTAQNGQDQYEQVYLVRKGENYGWSVMEGGHPFYVERKRGPTPIIPPTAEHPHSEARSLTGGFVYRGNAFPELVGAYLYGDYSTGRIWAIKHDGRQVTWHQEIARPRLQITCIAPDPSGEIYIAEHRGNGDGGFFALERTPIQAGPNQFPRKLSESGLFSDVSKHEMKPGVIHYTIAVPFWSDGAHKDRWIILPPGGKIGYTSSRGWNFPDRTVIVKSFAVDSGIGVRRWIETRFLTNQQGEWFGYSYRWNKEQTDADLVDSVGLTENIPSVDSSGNKVTKTWRYPSRTECMMCHTRAMNYVLGPSESQMNTANLYAGVSINQLDAFEAWGILDTGESGGLLKSSPDQLSRLADPHDQKQPLEVRARSFLHSNCSACHVKEGGGNSRMELEFSTPLAASGLVDAKPMHGALGVQDARIVAPGCPERSVLLKRMSTRGPGQMPPVATHEVDQKGRELIEEWIRSLKPITKNQAE